MPFLKRLLFFLIGVSLGTLMVVFLFGDRDIGCSYFPNDRVLSDFRKKNLVADSAINAQLVAMKIDSTEMFRMLNFGQIDFNNSSVKLDSCKEYKSVLDEGDIRWSAYWKNCNAQLILLKIEPIR
jgi:hypothetical protein